MIVANKTIMVSVVSPSLTRSVPVSLARDKWLQLALNTVAQPQLAWVSGRKQTFKHILKIIKIGTLNKGKLEMECTMQLTADRGLFLRGLSYTSWTFHTFHTHLQTIMLNSTRHMKTDAFPIRLNNNTAGVLVVLGSPLYRSIRQVSKWIQFDSARRQ